MLSNLNCGVGGSRIRKVNSCFGHQKCLSCSDILGVEIKLTLRYCRVPEWMPRDKGKKWGLGQKFRCTVIERIWVLCPNISVSIESTCWMMVLRNDAFEKWVGHESRTLMNGIYDLREEVSKRPSLLRPTGSARIWQFEV